MLQKHIGFGLTLLAIGLFFPGILAPMFSLNMELAGAMSGASMATELVNKELSIIGTVTQLFQEQRYLVSFLIFGFSVLIPLFKTSIVCIVYFSKNPVRQRKLSAFVSAIGKWSMADVFVVAIFLAVMSTNHAQSSEQHELSFLGMSVDFVVSTETLSSVGTGFYFFTAYCIISLLGSQLLLKSQKK
jgi:uncharacterized paraquat-inducible protein A